MKGQEKLVEVGLGLAKPEPTETGVAQLIAEGRRKVEALPKNRPELKRRGLERRHTISIEGQRYVVSVLQEVVAPWTKVGAVGLTILNVCENPLELLPGKPVLQSRNKNGIRTSK